MTAVCDHHHANFESEVACKCGYTMHNLTGNAVLSVVAAYDPETRLSDPAVTIIGNVTDVANMLRGVLEMVSPDPPQHCEQCLANWHCLVAARLALAGATGSC